MSIFILHGVSNQTMKIFVVVVEPNCYSLLTVVSILVWFVNCDHTDMQLVPVAEIMAL